MEDGTRGPGLPGSVLTALPPSAQVEKLQLLESKLGQMVMLHNGLHLWGGNIIFQYEIPSGADQGKTILFVAHGEGELEGPVVVWVNGKLFDHTDTSKYHFHPGLDGEVGFETDPATRNQKICSLWPSVFLDKFTFSRTAYSAFKLDPDPKAPDASFRILILGKGRRVRVFNSSGTQTDYKYSANNADVWLDLLISTYLKPRGLVNEALTSAEKAKVNFTAYDAYRTDCDASTPQSTKRCEAHPAFVNETELIRALNLVVPVLGRGYQLEFAGKLAPYLDKSRSSQITIGPDQIAAGSLQFGDKDLTEGPNRYVARYRNLESGLGPGTIATTGTAVTGTGTKFLTWFRADEVLQLEDGAQVGQARSVASVASDTSMTLKTAFSADQSGRKYSNPAVHFMEGSKVSEDRTLQDETGRVVSEELELNNQTPERAERIVKYVKGRNLDLEKQAALRALPMAGTRDLLPGDRLTTLKSQDLDPANTRDFTIVNMSLLPDGQVDLSLEEYDEAILSDAAGAQQAATPSLPGQGLLLVTGAGNYAYRPRSNPLTATDAGAAATINIAAFTMEIAQVGQKSYNSGAISSVSFDLLRWIAFKDPSLAGGTVTYEAFATKEDALQDGRFLVGSIITPKDGGPDTTGAADGGVGAQSGLFASYRAESTYTPVTGAPKAFENPTNAMDDDDTNFAGGLADANPETFTQWWLGFGSNTRQRVKSAVLKIESEVVNSGTGNGASLLYNLNSFLGAEQGGTFIFNLSNTGRSKQIDSVTLPNTQNLKTVGIRALASHSGVGGSVEVKIYRAWVEIEE